MHPTMMLMFMEANRVERRRRVRPQRPSSPTARRR